ncbi:MAG: protein kinase/lanthionine synthetase C family protein [Streptomycetaceae bacterium]|nr:protein kinase/lanthionine synthetase C family protein [Streptomycetaceae bacterium]
MDIRYPAFCHADARYYDSPERARVDQGQLDYRGLVDAPVDWECDDSGPWTRRMPPGAAATLPDQGWKIHVSATPDSAGTVLRVVSEYCFAKGVPFKFLSDSLVLRTRNGKYFPREASGKFVTIYPTDVAALEAALVDLDAELAGLPGPYILSDLRWNQGPLHVRYGGFAVRYTYDADGERVMALRRPDGTLVADRREPRFTVPDWVDVPSFLATAAAPRISGGDPADFPYEVTGALHFSNGGGVYRARRDGIEVVLKEARPHAGLDRLDRDAVERLRVEHSVLTALSGVPGVPEVYGYHRLGGHEFLAMEFVAGRSLQTWVATNYVRTGTADTSERLADYLASARRIVDQLADIVAGVHSRGLAINDLHPGNIMVGDDHTVTLLDFEAVQPVDHDGPRPLGAPGFVAPDSYRGVEADLYSLDAVRLFLHLPLNSLLALCPAKADDLIAVARERMGIDQEVADRWSARLTTVPDGPSGLRPAGPEFAAGAGPWRRVVTSIAASVAASATPHRDDRLFPGDIDQFTYGGGGLAYGAAGVLDTLRHAGMAVPADQVGWLVRNQEAGTRPTLGLYDGLAGVSVTLYGLGEPDTALSMMDSAAEDAAGVPSAKLFDGQAGIAIANLVLHRETGLAVYLGRAERSAQRLLDAVDTGALAVGAGGSGLKDRRGNAAGNFYAGLMYGWSGIALALVRTYEVTGDVRWLRGAVAALHRDLDLCEDLPDGSRQVRNNTRLLPYLATGSAGVAVVCDAVLAHASDERIADAVDPLARAAADPLCVCAGLFNGRAGLVYALHHLRGRLAWPDMDEVVAAGLRALDLHALRDEHGLVFPGEQNLRASTDLATGSAGVLRLLSVLDGDTAEILPLLTSGFGEPRPMPTTAAPAATARVDGLHPHPTRGRR